LVVIALLVVAVAGGDLGTGDRIGVAPLLAMAIGGQNAAVRQLKVFDLTTTVLTMTLTGMAADIRERDRFAVLRRLLAVGAMRKPRCRAESSCGLRVPWGRIRRPAGITQECVICGATDTVSTGRITLAGDDARSSVRAPRS